MTAVIEDLRPQTAVDLGSNAGSYVIRLAQRGIATVGVETGPRYVRVLTYARQRLEVANVGVMLMACIP